jgi:hypothetical protein
MFHGTPMPDERKKVRRAVDKWFDGPVRSLLARNGFVQAEGALHAQEPLEMFRSLPEKVEVVGCRLAQRSEAEETELYVETGVFLEMCLTTWESSSRALRTCL